MSLRPQGFTLIEIIIAVAIIAILSAVTIPMMQRYIDRSKSSAAASSLAVLQLQMERWRSENPSYPNSEDFATQLKSVNASSDGEYEVTILEADADGYTLGAKVDVSKTNCSEMTLSFDGDTISRAPSGCFK